MSGTDFEPILTELITNQRARPLPALTQRLVRSPALRGKVDALIGMRRAGKTFYCYQRMHELVAAGVPRDRMLYLSFEDERLEGMQLADLAQIPEIFYRHSSASRDEQHFFFLDEVQELTGWERFVRRLLDTENVQLTVTGSSAKLLSREVATSLRGRSISTEIFPFSFAETLTHAGIDDTKHKTSAQRSLLERRLDDYLVRGGFAETQQLDETLRVRVLQEYLDVAVLRDVIERHDVTNIGALRRFVRQLMNMPAGLLSIHRMYLDLKSQGISVGKDSLHDFLDHVSDAYLFFTTEIHARSERVRQSNPRKVYCIDPGMVTACARQPGLGALLETFVFLTLRRHRAPIHYYRTAAGFEIDFLVELPNREVLVQACADLSDADTAQRELRALDEAMLERKLRTSYLITRYEQRTIELTHGVVEVLPAWRWALENEALLAS